MCPKHWRAEKYGAGRGCLILFDPWLSSPSSSRGCLEVLPWPRQNRVEAQQVQVPSAGAEVNRTVASGSSFAREIA